MECRARMYRHERIMNQESRIKRTKDIIHYSLFIIHKSHKGFTLIELLVVISIIGILSSFLLVNFVGVRQRARDGVRKSDLRQIQSALELYRSDQGSYPASLPSCGSSLQDSSSSSSAIVYMKKISCDPSTGSLYTYTVSGGNVSYSIIACLENENDFQIDQDGSGNKVNCSDSTTLWQYTLQNP